MTPKMIAEQLGNTGLCICPDFLSLQSLNDLRFDLEQIQEAGELYRASTGQGENKHIQDSVRRDEIHWLNPNAEISGQQALWEKLNLLKGAFNQTLYLGLGEFEGHYASYPSGGFYQKHLDCFRNSNSRVVSIIIYLNQNWNALDGGQLRIYEKNLSHTDVEPIGGTLVCFLSRESEHEVLVCNRQRLSFTGWFKSYSLQGPLLGEMTALTHKTI